MLEAKTAQLCAEYDTYRQRTRTGYQFRPATKPKTIERKRQAMAEMASWCRERGVDPRAWLHSLFAVRGWRYSVKLDSLCSERHLSRHPELVGRALAIRDDRVTFNPATDLSNTCEQQKAMLLTVDAELCLDDPKMRGYHVGSRVCGGCPLRMKCRKKYAHWQVGRVARAATSSPAKPQT